MLPGGRNFEALPSQIPDPVFVSFFTIWTTLTKAQSSLSTDSLLRLVKEAYIYGYPIEQSYRMYVTLPDNIGQTKRVYNHFSYAGKLASASPDNTLKIAAYKSTRNRGGAGPNNDTPYYIGSSFGDNGAAEYLLIGPKWKGKVPEGLKPIRFTYEHLNLFGRTLVEDDSADIKNIVALQRQSSLTPLSRYPAEVNHYTGLERNDLPSYYNSIDSFFTNLNNALKLSPAAAQDKPMLTQVAANLAVTGVFVEFYFFRVSVCVLRIFFF